MLLLLQQLRDLVEVVHRVLALTGQLSVLLDRLVTTRDEVGRLANCLVLHGVNDEVAQRVLQDVLARLLQRQERSEDHRAVHTRRDLHLHLRADAERNVQEQRLRRLLRNRHQLAVRVDELQRARGQVALDGHHLTLALHAGARAHRHEARRLGRHLEGLRKRHGLHLAELGDAEHLLVVHFHVLAPVHAHLLGTHLEAAAVPADVAHALPLAARRAVVESERISGSVRVLARVVRVVHHAAGVRVEAAPVVAAADAGLLDDVRVVLAEVQAVHLRQRALLLRLQAGGDVQGADGELDDGVRVVRVHLRHAGNLGRRHRFLLVYVPRCSQ
eukprot:Rhum_TRINITY_DN212_c0_g1::Rhum_TRINITY_DN212_c0_g1_i1::g.762::m.762